MNYGEACAYLDALNGLGCVPGLDGVAQLLERLGEPQQKLRFVHISGTNGKGSVGAFVTSVLIEAGYCTGRYLSPAVRTPLEIIQCGRRNISPDEYAEIISRIKPVCDAMRADGLAHPTRFEIETAAAFLFFLSQKCDICVVECGMGGLFDATNIIGNTECAVITPISADHTAFLGDSLEEIALHKAGIIKRGARVVYAAGEAAVNRVIEKKAAACGCPAAAVFPDQIQWHFSEDGRLVLDYGHYPGASIGLAGLYQTVNAALGIECIEALQKQGYRIERSAMYGGLAKTRWFGRFERIGRRPDFILDGAHNPDGARALAESLRAYYPKGGLTFIVGVFADKDYPKILECTMPFAAAVFAVSAPDHPRALSSKTLAEYIKKYYDVRDVSVTDCQSVGEAVGLALARTDPSGAVVAFGSLSHLALIEEEYRRRIEEE